MIYIIKSGICSNNRWSDLIVIIISILYFSLAASAIAHDIGMNLSLRAKAHKTELLQNAPVKKSGRDFICTSEQAFRIKRMAVDFLKCC